MYGKYLITFPHKARLICNPFKVTRSLSIFLSLKFLICLSRRFLQMWFEFNLTSRTKCNKMFAFKQKYDIARKSKTWADIITISPIGKCFIKILLFYQGDICLRSMSFNLSRETNQDINLSLDINQYLICRPYHVQIGP